MTYDERFNGHWILFSAKPFLPETYSFRVTDGEGICTKTNAPGVYDVGDLIFQVKDTWGDRFRALQMFSDGKFYSCSGVLDNDEMHLQEGSWEWVMIRIDDPAD
jgi:hypothetical protein